MRRLRGIRDICFPSLDCTNEYFEILDGPPSSAESLGKPCSGFHMAFASHSSSMTLVYFRGMNNIGKNFMAYYYFETKGKQNGMESQLWVFCQCAIIGSVTLNKPFDWWWICCEASRNTSRVPKKSFLKLLWLSSRMGVLDYTEEGNMFPLGHLSDSCTTYKEFKINMLDTIRR